MKNFFVTLSVYLVATFDKQMFAYRTTYYVTVDGTHATCKDITKPSERSREFSALDALKIINHFKLTQNHLNKEGRAAFDGEIRVSDLETAMVDEDGRYYFSTEVMLRKNKPRIENYTPVVNPKDNERDTQFIQDTEKSRYKRDLQDWWDTLTPEEQAIEAEKDSTLQFYIPSLAPKLNN